MLAYGKLSTTYYVAHAFDMGAHGYRLQKSAPVELVHAVGTVGLPGDCFCARLLGWRYVPDAARAAPGLSKRAMEVLGLLAEGLTKAKIALRLFTSKSTIETHHLITSPSHH